MMGFFDGFGIGDALGIAGDLFGTSSALDAQDAMLEKQMAFNREVMQNRHQWEVSDLKAAGLNPLMSVTSPTGTLSAPTPAQVPRMNLAQSAAAMSQVSLNKSMAEAALTNAAAAKTNADANMIKAQNDTNRTNFMMGPEFELRTQVSNAEMNKLIADAGLSNSQRALNVLQAEWLPKLLKADLDYKQMQTAICELVGKAQAYNYRVSADASMVSANAHAYQASSYASFVDSVRSLNISQEFLNSDKGKEAIAVADNIAQKTRALARENDLNDELYQDNDFRQAYQGGATMNALLGGHSLKSMIPY